MYPDVFDTWWQRPVCSVSSLMNNEYFFLSGDRQNESENKQTKTDEQLIKIELCPKKIVCRAECLFLLVLFIVRFWFWVFVKMRFFVLFCFVVSGERVFDIKKRFLWCTKMRPRRIFASVHIKCQTLFYACSRFFVDFTWCHRKTPQLHSLFDSISFNWVSCILAIFRPLTWDWTRETTLQQNRR